MFELFPGPLVGELVEKATQVLALDGGGAEGEEEVVAGLPQLRDAAVGRAVYRPRLHNTQLRQYKPWKLKATCGGSGSKGNVRFCRIRDLVKINLSQHNNYNLQARVPYACK